MNGFLVISAVVLALYFVVGTVLALASCRFGMGTSRDYFVAGYRLGGFLAAMTYTATTYLALMMVGLVGLTYMTGVGEERSSMPRSCRTFSGLRLKYCQVKALYFLSVHIMSGDVMSVKLTVRVPRELKERMDRFSHVNWSEVIREAIEERVREEEVKWALRIMNEISTKAKPERPLAEVIREFRDRR